MVTMVGLCLKMKRNRLFIASTNSTNSSNSSNRRCQGWQQRHLLGIIKKLRCSWSIVMNKESPKLAMGVTISSHQWFTPIIPSKSIIIIVCHTITICHQQIWVVGSVSQNSLHLEGWVWSQIHHFILLPTPVTNLSILLKVEFQIQAQNFCIITSRTKIKLIVWNTSLRWWKVLELRQNKELKAFYQQIILVKSALCLPNTTITTTQKSPVSNYHPPQQIAV
jgi:hypothetical protein